MAVRASRITTRADVTGRVADLHRERHERGNRTVQLRVASPGGATMHVGFNAASNVWETVSIPATGGWQTWTTVSVPVTLGGGTQQLTLLFDTGGMNIRTIVVN
jgi:hypothetical protein